MYKQQSSYPQRIQQTVICRQKKKKTACFLIVKLNLYFENSRTFRPASLYLF